MSSPQWLPDGSGFFFLTNRGKSSGEDDGPKQQVYSMMADGGEAWERTEHEEGVQSFRVSPDGTKLAFLSRDPLSKEKKKRNKQKDDTVVVDQEFRWTHLWVWELGEDEAIRLTSGDYTVGDPRWSPDGEQIAYVTRPTTKNDDSWNSDVWVISSTGGDARLIHENAGTDSSPRWSPDGRTIAFASKPYLKTNTYYSKLLLAPADGEGGTRTLLEEFDRDFSSPIWSKDGAQIFWSTGDKTQTSLFSVAVPTGEVERLGVPEGSNRSFELSADGEHWIFVHAAPGWPSEVMTSDRSFARVQSVSNANEWLRDEQVALANNRTVRWKNSEGQEIEGVLTLPVGYEEGKSYPLIMNPHGGPSGAVTRSWSSTNQFLAGNGFMILQPNFRGSSNYGQEFLNANRNYWGIRDYDDCMTGVDYAVEQGWADPDRLVAYGWSYGGYMTFWMSTQTDRFKVISPGAGLSNLYSMYSTTDISNYLGWFFGTPWDNEEIYRRLSPIRHAKNVKSKVLIMTGAEDERVPPEQSVEFYRALKDLDKDVELVMFPREGHGIREPRHQMDRLRRYLTAFSEAVELEPKSEKRWEEAVASAAKSDDSTEEDSSR